MRQAVTFRLDTELLAAARECAAEENRTLTNFIETLLKRHLAGQREPAARDARSGEAPRHA